MDNVTGHHSSRSSASFGSLLAALVQRQPSPAPSEVNNRRLAAAEQETTAEEQKRELTVYQALLDRQQERQATKLDEHQHSEAAKVADSSRTRDGRSSLAFGVAESSTTFPATPSTSPKLVPSSTSTASSLSSTPKARPRPRPSDIVISPSARYLSFDEQRSPQPLHFPPPRRDRLRPPSHQLRARRSASFGDLQLQLRYYKSSGTTSSTSIATGSGSETEAADSEPTILGLAGEIEQAEAAQAATTPSYKRPRRRRSTDTLRASISSTNSSFFRRFKRSSYRPNSTPPASARSTTFSFLHALSSPTMIRSPPSPSSPSSPSRTHSPSITNTKRSTFGISRSSSSSNRNGGSSLFSFGGGGGNSSTPSSANTSPTHAFNSAVNLPPSPGASHLRESTFPFSAAGGGTSSTSSLSRPSFDNPSSTSALAPSPSLVSSSMFGRSTSKRLERKNTRVASASRGADRSQFSASELDGMFDSYSGGGGGGGPGSPGPGSLTGDSMHSSDREPGSGALGAGEAVGLKRKGWYAEYIPKGEIGRQRYMWTEEGAQAVPWWVSYSQGARNWDALLTSSLFVGSNSGTTAFLPPPPKSGAEPQLPPPPPKRVLDIGSGSTSLWSIMQASQPGWETTQFVGLDIAPSDIPHAYLDYDISNRLSYVQHNFLEPLPFDDDRFDFVRVANVGLGVPEHMWADLIEEATRVLSPGCHLEVVEHNFAVLRKRPLIKTPKAFSMGHQEDPDVVIDECFDAVLEERFINPHTLGMIPSQLALNCTNIRSSGLITLPLPSRPPPPARPPTPSSPTQPSLSPQHSPLTSYSAGLTSSPSPLSHLSPSLPHLYLHAYADRYASSSHAIASSTAARRQRRSGVANGAEQRQRQDLLHLELDETVRGWASELRDRAGLASVVRNLWGWDCAMDGKMKGMLEDQLPVFDEKIRGFDAAYEDEGWQAVVGITQAEGEWWDPEIEFRRAQVAFAKREATIELGRVKARLGEKEETDEESGEDVGMLEMGTFVARAS